MKLRVLTGVLVLTVAAVAVYGGRHYFSAAVTFGIDQSQKARDDVAADRDP